MLSDLLDSHKIKHEIIDIFGNVTFCELSRKFIERKICSLNSKTRSNTKLIIGLTEQNKWKA